MFIYNRYFKFTLRFNKVNYFSKYNQYSNNLINNLSISTNYLLTKSNLFIQYRYYSSNKSNTLHLLEEKYLYCINKLDFDTILLIKVILYIFKMEIPIN